MKKIFIFAVAFAAVLSASAATDADSAATDTVKGFVFRDVTVVPTTTVKDQNKSGTCWCFAGTSFFEDEILRQTGDTIDLSEMFTVRHCYMDKADRYVRMYGQANFAAGGSVLDVPYVWERYGAVPEDVYSGLNYGEEKHVHGELDGILGSYVGVIVKNPNKKISPVWRKGFEGVLDAYLGVEPETFTYKGKTYTPKTFAASLPINLDNYVALTSFTHHPFYEQFVFEVPDNWLWAQYYNLPLDEFKEVVDNAVANGYTVAWAADVSEGGFKWTEGVAVMPKGKAEGDMSGTELARWVKLSDKEREADKYDIKGPVEEMAITQEIRQQMFDSQETTDDHGMVIVGAAEDQNGNRYYKVKNSWDTNHVYGGFFYVSEPYFMAKTLNIYVNKAAVPSAIAKKLGFKD